MKLCECGCGQPTNIIKKTSRAYGRIKGLQSRFLTGHASRINPTKVSNVTVVCEVDGEMLRVQRRNSRRGSPHYARVMSRFGRLHLHTYIARKVFAILGREWTPRTVVHHINYDIDDWGLCNLSAFSSPGTHRSHHSRLEEAMYTFLASRGLLETFYGEHPDLKLETLRDLLDQCAKGEVTRDYTIKP